MDLKTFLTAVRALDPPHVVLFENVHKVAATTSIDERFVFVGCDPMHEVTAQSPAKIPLLLTNKASMARFGRSEDYVSVSALVADNPANFLGQWSLWPAENPVDPAELFRQIRIVAEDAGPDSIFSVLLLLGRAAGVDPEEFPHVWLDAVNRWERDGNSDDPARSWCALESALVHQSFPMKTGLTEDAMREAWSNGLRFATDALSAGGPETLPRDAISHEHARAAAALEQERQLYEEWLRRAQVVQLLLPLKDSIDRRLLVDALLIEEDQIAGAAKVFYRNDKVNSPLGQGFGLAANYRLNSTESKFDITISVDPRRGIGLKDLHKAIETAEDQKWSESGQSRPQTRPRYMDNVPNIYDEPWYMNREHTLIGSPRRLQSGDSGSLLTWEEIREKLWSVYCPLHGVLVSQEKNLPVPVSILSARSKELKEGSTEKQLFTASWLKADKVGAIRSLPNAPTVWQIMAAMTKKPQESKHGKLQATAHYSGGTLVQPPPLSDLPQVGSYKHIKLIGGFAVISESGAFIIDDWTAQRVGLPEMESAFAAASTLHDRLAELRTDLDFLTSHVQEALAMRFTVRQVKLLLGAAARLSTEASAVRASSAIPPSTANSRAFRQSLNDAWGLEAKLDSYEKAISSLQGALRNVLEAGTAVLTRFITAFGFGAAIGGTLAGPLAKTLYSEIYSLPPATDAPGWWVMIAFTLLVAVGATLVYSALRTLKLLPAKVRGRLF